MLIKGFLVTFGLALLAGAGVLALEKLVPSRRREMHNDVLGFVYAVIGVAYAVLLGLVVVAAWNTLDEAQANTYTESNALFELYWYGHSLPPPLHDQVEHLVEEYATVVIHDEWPLLSHQQSSSRAWDIVTQLKDLVMAQDPTGPAAVARYQQALEGAADLGDARRERIEQAAEGIPAPLWSALLLGAVITIGFAFFFGMKSTVAHAFVMFSLTLIVVCLLMVVYELDYPFTGVVAVTPEAFKLALERMQLIN